jgi:uncharacterized protein (TIGR03083 family)
MATLAERTIAALRAGHDALADLTAGLSDEQLAATSGASQWPVSQVLSHLGSGAEIALAGLQAALAGTDAPAQEFNQSVWDRWNAMTPRQQADGFRHHNGSLVAAYEQIDAETRESHEIQLAFLPMPLPLAAVAGMRLNESALHQWDVLVAFDPTAGMDAVAAQVLAEQLSGPLSFMPGFFGKADQYDGSVLVALADSGFSISIDETVAITRGAAGANATFTGPLEAAVRLLGGRLTPAHTPAGVEVVGAIELDDLRRVFPGY